MNQIISNEFSISKSQKIKNNGDNIVQKIDINSIVKEFINFYYTSFNNNPIDLINHKMIREYSSLKYKGIKYNGEKFFNTIINFTNGKIKMVPQIIEFMDSGSRRIDISILGVVSDNKQSKNFNQTFLISHNKDGWYIKNSILIIQGIV